MISSIPIRWEYVSVPESQKPPLSPPASVSHSSCGFLEKSGEFCSTHSHVLDLGPLSLSLSICLSLSALSSICLSLLHLSLSLSICLSLCSFLHLSLSL